MKGLQGLCIHRQEAKGNTTTEARAEGDVGARCSFLFFPRLVCVCVNDLF
jgi:hypothetical protein